MPKEYLDCVAALKAEGKSEDEAQRICAIAYYKKHGRTPQEDKEDDDEEEEKAFGSSTVRQYGTTEPPNHRTTERSSENRMSSDWIQIFRAGAYPGKVPLGPDELEAMARLYDPAKHEAPLVLGHPDTDSPAHGWVERLRRVGETLWAKVRQLSPELLQAVREGAFKHVSMAVFPDFNGTGKPYLRHVGFLGAAIPVVKGLAPIKWAEGDYQEIDLELPIAEALDRQGAVLRVLNGLYLLVERVHGILDQVSPDARKQAILDQVESLRSLVEAESFTEGQKGGAPMTFWERLKALFAEAGVQVPGEEPPASTAGQFTEDQVRERERAAAEKATKDAELAAARRQRVADAKAKVAAFVEAGIAAGTFLPAWREAGLPAVIEQGLLAEAATFAEGQEARTPGEVLLAVFAEMPKIVPLGEIAKPGKGDRAGEAPAAQIEALVNQRMEQKRISYGVAFAEVQREQPELAAQYLESVRPGRRG